MDTQQVLIETGNALISATLQSSPQALIASQSQFV